VVSPAVSPDGFPAFFAETEPRLRRALVAAYGPQRGREAAAEALAYAWQHWDRVGGMGFGWTYREVAEMTELSISSVQSYRERGLRKLREALGVTEGA
jgi:DNA-directed RNA polymerase specialized sigma24 family protein